MDLNYKMLVCLALLWTFCALQGGLCSKIDGIKFFTVRHNENASMVCRREGMEISELDKEGVEGVKKEIKKEKDGKYEFVRKDEAESDPRCHDYITHFFTTVKEEKICYKPLDIYMVICAPTNTNTSGLGAKTPDKTPETSQARLVAGVLGAFFGGIGLACLFFWCFASADLKTADGFVGEEALEMQEFQMQELEMGELEGRIVVDGNDRREEAN